MKTYRLDGTLEFEGTAEDYAVFKNVEQGPPKPAARVRAKKSTRVRLSAELRRKLAALGLGQFDTLKPYAVEALKHRKKTEFIKLAYVDADFSYKEGARRFDGLIKGHIVLEAPTPAVEPVPTPVLKALTKARYEGVRDFDEQVRACSSPRVTLKKRGHYVGGPITGLPGYEIKIKPGEHGPQVEVWDRRTWIADGRRGWDRKYSVVPPSAPQEDLESLKSTVEGQIDRAFQTVASK